ncbi:MAG: hypothetical protein V1676_05590 [Candidatus Diapherotrites archaeon]
MHSQQNAESSLPIEKLRKTSAEQAIWRSIQELESELRDEHDDARREQLSEQISNLKNNLASLQGPAYIDLERENTRLKKELAVTKAKLMGALKECNALKGCATISVSGNEKQHEQVQDLRSRLYRTLLTRYSDLINEFEKKTVGELKSLVDEKDLTIQSLLQEYRHADYSFEKHYPQAAARILDFLQRDINYVESDLEINFWLTPKEIMRGKIADDEDLAIFLCSLLSALGDSSAEVVIAELENLTTHAFVITERAGTVHAGTGHAGAGQAANERAGKFTLLDPSRSHAFSEFSGEKKEVLQKYTFNGQRIRRFLYRFNSTNYEQFV